MVKNTNWSKKSCFCPSKKLLLAGKFGAPFTQIGDILVPARRARTKGGPTTETPAFGNSRVLSVRDLVLVAVRSSSVGSPRDFSFVVLLLLNSRHHHHLAEEKG